MVPHACYAHTSHVQYLRYGRAAAKASVQTARPPLVLRSNITAKENSDTQKYFLLHSSSMISYIMYHYRYSSQVLNLLRNHRRAAPGAEHELKPTSCPPEDSYAQPHQPPPRHCPLDTTICSKPSRAYDDEDDLAGWSGSGSSEGGGYDDDDDNSDAWNSYDDDEEGYGDDRFPSSGDGGGGRGRGTPSSSSSGLDYYSQEDDDQQEERGFWSDHDGDGGYDDDGYDDDDDDDMGGDSWDEEGDDTPPTSPRGRTSRGTSGMRAPPSRRPRPSAWTGDGGSSGRRRPSGRGVPPRGRSGARGSSSAVARYDQRGRRRAAPGGFAVRMPAVNGVALASALRRQMGTAKEAVGQAGSLAASTSKKLKREVIWD